MYSSVQRARFVILLLAIFWLIVGVVTLIPGSGSWPSNLFRGNLLNQITVASTGIASVTLAVFLLLRRAWARPAAVIYHLWLGGILLILVLRPTPFFIPLLNNFPRWLTQETWAWFLRTGLVLISIISFSVAYFLEQLSAWDAFSEPRLNSKRLVVCPKCGATRQRQGDQEFCSYCDTSLRVIYFLQPVLKNARRILLLFEPGHSRIHVGRSVGNSEAWIDTSEHKRYRTISRHHADIEIDFKTGALTVHKALTSQDLLVDDQPVMMSAPVQLGSLIQMGKVQFVLGNSDYEPTLAYFVEQLNEEQRFLLRFNGLDNEQTIGRGKDCNIVLSDFPDIDHHHITIIFDPTSQMFFARTESGRHPVYIDGHILDLGKAQPLSTQELIVIQLGSHNFNFLPVLYQPQLNEAVA